MFTSNSSTNQILFPVGTWISPTSGSRISLGCSLLQHSQSSFIRGSPSSGCSAVRSSSHGTLLFPVAPGVRLMRVQIVVIVSILRQCPSESVPASVIDVLLGVEKHPYQAMAATLTACILFQLLRCDRFVWHPQGQRLEIISLSSS